MNKKIAKKVVSVVLALALLASVVSMSFTVSAADFELTWPAVDAWAQGTAPAWANVADDADDAQDVASVTMQAILDEYDYQAEQGFDMGTMNGGVTAWGNMVNVQFENGDHTSSPWADQPTRRMGGIIAPYPGIAFSIKGDRAKQYGRIPIGNETTYTNGDVYIVQAVTDGFIVTNNTSGETAHWGFTVGAGAPDEVKAKMQYAYAAASAGITFGERVTLGYTDVNVTLEGDAYYQQIKSDAGEAYIVAADGADEAYIVMGDVLTAWATTWTGESKLGATGAPIGNAVEDENGVVTQEFDYATITVTPAAEEGGDATVEIKYDVVAEAALVALTSADNYTATANGGNVPAVGSMACDGDCVSATYDTNGDGQFDLKEGEKITLWFEPAMPGADAVDPLHTTFTADIPAGSTSFSGIVSLCDRGVAQDGSGPGGNYIEIIVRDAEGNVLNPNETKYLMYKEANLDPDPTVYDQEGFVTGKQRVAFDVALTADAASIEIVAYNAGWGWADHTVFINTGFTVPVAEEDVAAAKAFTKTVKALRGATAEDSADVKAARAAYDAMGATAKSLVTLYDEFVATEAAVRAAVTVTPFEAEAAVMNGGANGKCDVTVQANKADSGIGGAEGFDEDDTIDFTVYVAEAGEYYVAVDYSYDGGWGGYRAADIIVNGETKYVSPAGAYPATQSSYDGADNLYYEVVELKAGKNIITLCKGENSVADMFHLDRILVEGAVDSIAAETAIGTLADGVASWTAAIEKNEDGDKAIGGLVDRINEDISETVDYGVIYGVDEAAVAAATDNVMDGEKYVAKKVAFGTDENGNIKRTFGVTMKNVAEGVEPVVKFYVVYKDNAGATHTVYSDVVGVAAAATPDGE